MNDNTENSKILDLDALSYKLNELVDKFDEITDEKHLIKLLKKLLSLLRYRSKYSYLFSHGGARTGFMGLSSDLLNTSNKILSLIKIGANAEVITENSSRLVSEIKEICYIILVDSDFKNPDPLTLKMLQMPKRRDSITCFVSYSHQDETAQSIIPIIKIQLGSSVNLWIDQFDLMRYQQLPQELSKAINSSSSSILILSKNFFISKWCSEEWQSIFMKRMEKPDYRIYIIRIDDEIYPPLLNSFYYTDCREFPKVDAKIELGKLLAEINQYETSYRFNIARAETTPKQPESEQPSKKTQKT